MSSRIDRSERRYLIEFSIAAVLYGVVLYGAKLMARDVEPSPVLTLLALAPQLPITYACYAFLRYFYRADERERRLIADAAAIALLIGSFCALSLGLFTSFGILSVQWDMNYAAAFLIGLWGLVRCFLQYRR